MNWVDVFLVLILLLSVINGLKSGFVIGVVEFLRFIVSVIVALLTFGWAALALQVIGIPVNAAKFFGFFLVMVFVQIILTLALKPVTDRIKKALKDSPVGPVDKAFGPPPQISMFLISMSFFLALIITFPIFTPLKNAVLQSRFGKPLAEPVVRVLSGGKTADEIKYAPASDSV
ncbi:MAG: CvpA family protein [Actinomycetota bacterium]